jgi:hypothetical protein
MGEQMFRVKSEVVSYLERVMISFKVLNKKFVKGGASQFQNLCALFSYEIITVRVGYHKFCARCDSDGLGSLCYCAKQMKCEKSQSSKWKYQCFS